MNCWSGSWGTFGRSCLRWRDAEPAYAISQSCRCWSWSGALLQLAEAVNMLTPKLYVFWNIRKEPFLIIVPKWFAILCVFKKRQLGRFNFPYTQPLPYLISIDECCNWFLGGRRIHARGVRCFDLDRKIWNGKHYGWFKLNLKWTIGWYESKSNGWGWWPLPIKGYDFGENH